MGLFSKLRRKYLFLLLLVFFSIIGAIAVLGQTTSKVKITRINGQDPPAVSIDPISSNIKVLAIPSCATPDVLARYANYIEIQEKNAACMDGYANATLLLEKVADLKTSIAEIDKRLVWLDDVKQSFAARKDLDNLIIKAIPAGKLYPKSYKTATNIAPSCLKNPDKSTEGAAVGSAGADKLSIFEALPTEQVAAIQDAKKKASDLEKKIKEELAKKGKIGKVTIMSLAFTLKEIQKSMAANTILIPSIDHGIPEKAIMEFDVLYRLNSDKEKVLHNLPEFLKTVTGIDEPFVEANVFIDQHLFAGVWLPENKMLLEMRSGTEKHIARLKNIREQLKAVLDSFSQKLQTLEKNNYNCG